MDYLQQSAQPNIVLLHLATCMSPLTAYTLYTILAPSAVAQFTAVVLLGALHFWVVKNVSGRKLVGLRWWASSTLGSALGADRDGTTTTDGTSTADTGSKRWLFEAKEAPWEPNRIDAKVFWWSLYVLPAVWGMMVVSAVVSVSLYWAVCASLVLTMHLINLVGYAKCDKDASKREAAGITVS